MLVEGWLVARRMSLRSLVLEACQSHVGGLTEAALTEKNATIFPAFLTGPLAI